MKKPIIGIVGRCESDEKDRSYFYIFEGLRRCIYNLGGEVLLLLPPSKEDCYKTSAGWQAVPQIRTQNSPRH